jgi:hypothetical protein
MTMVSRIPIRAGVAVAASLMVIVVGAGIGGASTSSPSPPVTRTISSSSRGIAVSIPAPPVTQVESSLSWCCDGASGPGLTVTGQANVNGQGANGRDQAIAQAVADATDQATAAAEAAGVTLGQVIDMQVSASLPYPCPVAGEAGGTAIAGPTASAGGSSPPDGAIAECEPSVPCPAQQCAGAYATVTMTWSIG